MFLMIVIGVFLATLWTMKIPDHLKYTTAALVMLAGAFVVGYLRLEERVNENSLQLARLEGRINGIRSVAIDGKITKEEAQSIAVDQFDIPRIQEPETATHP